MSLPTTPAGMADWAGRQTEPESIATALRRLQNLHAASVYAADSDDDPGVDYGALIDILAEHAGVLTRDILEALDGLACEPALVRNPRLSEGVARDYLEKACSIFLDGRMASKGLSGDWMLSLDTLSAWDETRGPLPTSVLRRALRDVVHDGCIEVVPSGPSPASHRPFFLWSNLVGSLTHLPEHDLWALYTDIREDPISRRALLRHPALTPDLALRLLADGHLTDDGLAVLVARRGLRRDPDVQAALWAERSPVVHREYLLDDAWLEEALGRGDDTPRQLTLELLEFAPTCAAEVLACAPDALLARLRPEEVLPALSVSDPHLRRRVLLRLPDLDPHPSTTTPSRGLAPYGRPPAVDPPSPRGSPDPCT